jgi:hypothetical protein
MPLPGILASQISGHLFAPSGAYDALATVTVPAGQTAASIVFAGIPSGYKHLQLRTMCFGSNNQENLYIRFNGDTGSNYARHYLLGDGSSASASATAPDSGGVFSNTSTASSPYVSICDILDFASNNKNKTLRALSGRDTNGAGDITLRSSFWNNTAAITSLNIYAGAGTLSSGTTIALYGVK